ncbi:MAG: hypothetical protein M3R69_15695 [Acidobacteriota bacterium]|nr:hypothetical protein [Acidobacteriota bacterium]
MRAYLNCRTLLLVLVALVAVVTLGTPAFGQCSMCRAALAGSNNALFIRNFNIGVLVLLVPPVTIFCSIFVVLKRYKRADERTDSAGSSDLETSR